MERINKFIKNTIWGRLLITITFPIWMSLIAILFICFGSPFYLVIKLYGEVYGLVMWIKTGEYYNPID